jgi:glyoxylase-like metal-dependent hydrolase (beta-lactamase superfamily II)
VHNAKRFSYEPERLADDLHCIPLPLFDGSPVNTFVAQGDDGLWLIDGGLGTAECQATLARGLESLGFTLADVRGVLITHGHSDHIGAAQAVAANGGAILAHRLESSQGRRLAFDEPWLERNGLPTVARSDPWSRRQDWPPPTRLLEDGERLRWGNLDLEVVWCPGHTPGLVCLFEPNRRLLFTTDHVMRRAPAPVSVRSDTANDPLGDYLRSVRKLAPLPVETVLPGHGRPFGGLARRLAHIESEIEDQLQLVRGKLSGGAATAYQLLSVHGLRDHRPVAERYALSLVLARLKHLECLGQVARLDQPNGITYALTDSAN